MPQLTGKMDETNLRAVLLLWCVSLMSCYDTFSPQTATMLRQIVVDDVSGNVYLGADNLLCQLNPNLDLMHDVSLGPKMDNEECIPATAKLNAGHCLNPSAELSQTNNIVKILVIDQHQSALIVCGNVYQGSCQMRNLQNIEELISWPTSQGHWVIANKGDNASYGFIAAGPSGTNVLYVGASFAEPDSALVILPSIAIRKVDKTNSEQMFKLYKNSESENKRTLYRSRSRNAHVIYNGGFASGSYRYFSTIKPTTPGSGVYKSRLTRICQSDEGDFRNRKLISYTEAQMECKKDGTNFQLLQALAIGKAGSELATKLKIISQSDIVIALFAQAQEGKHEPTGDSAICIYTIKEIELAFENKTRDCWNGKGFSGLSFDGQNNRPKCNAQTKAFNQCNVLSNSPLELDNPITKTAAFILQEDTMLSLAVNSHEEYSVAFIGTKNGKLLKILLESDKDVSMFSNAQIRTTPVEQLALSKGHDFVYAMATDQLVKVPVAECETYDNCSSCISSNNPYCGWCVLKNRCSTQDECDNSSQDIHWKRGAPDQCITITSVSPTSAPANQQEEVTLNVQAQLPQDEVYECVFEKYGNTPASVRQNEDGTAVVTCNTPIVQNNMDHNMPVQLSLKASSNIEPFVHAPDLIMIFDCKIITTCKECSAIGVPDSGCKWCPYDGGCIYQSEMCMKGTHVTSVNVCPTLEYVEYEDKLIPAGVQRSFRVHGRHLPESVGRNDIGYSCDIYIDGNKQTTGGHLTDSNSLECNPNTYTYSSTKGIVHAEVSIIFGGVEIDKPDDLEVEVYNCLLMASDCSQCQGQISADYKCSWCSATNQCSLFTAHCANRLDDDDKTCPAPTVNKIEPVAGPVSGGTKVTITGVNLGVEFQDIESIYVADTVCNHMLYGEQYQVSTTVVCETGWSPKPSNGPIRITVRGQTQMSAVQFKYLNPEITSISPKIGPKSGGSALTIMGNHLDIGSSARVEIGTEQCVIIGKRRENEIVCRTTRAGGPKKVKVQLVVDKEEIIADNILYQYVADPIITNITPTCSLAAGGIKVTVSGTNLHSIQVAKIDVDMENTDIVASSVAGMCKIIYNDGNSMVCPTPSLQLKAGSDQAMPIPIVFKLDENIELRNLNPAQIEDSGPASLSYYPDFTVDKWVNETTDWTWAGSEVSNDSSAYLRIVGKHLTLEGKVAVKVTVGGLECEMTPSSTDSEVLCSPPSLTVLQQHTQQNKNNYKVEDNNTDRKKRDTLIAKNKKDPPKETLFKVKVVMGNREESPGSLNYRITSAAIESQVGSSDIPLPVVLGTVFAIIVMAIVVTLLIFKYRENSQRLTEQSEVTKKKMHDLESQVARECKDAFTELQMMVMNDISPISDLTSLPFLDFSTYAYKVLFPNIEDFQRSTSRFHAAAPNNRAAVIAGLKDFHTLLCSEPFILNFIHTLEQQPRFNMKDRCNVASLLMVALCERLDYATYIMSRLLFNLMKRPQIKTSPHLFLRRTESVAEKFLTNWLTFCLYDHVKQVAGKPLYMLYRAIKATIETGPVDSVSYQARYALSEDRLLRQKIDFKTLNVFLQVEGGQMPVKLLDCDTISQAKCKLHDTWYNYKNTPVSQRVPVDSLELRLVGQHQYNVLRDEDETSVVEGEWKRLNTLRHYKVAENAVFAFVADSTATNRFGHFMDHSTHFSSNPKLNRSMDLASSNPKLNRRGSGSSCGLRPYHLTKTNASSTIDSDQTTLVHVPEIYLTRLLTTKGTLQHFVNDLFVSIFSLSNGDVPLAIKFLFDMLDRQAAENGITDPDIIHTWKNNSIPLRFWINIIKNPEMILDVEKHPLIDSILSVISQTYMDSCSLSNHAFSTDSPSSKLLYAKELQDYKPAVRKFYSDIQALPPVTDEKLFSSLPSTDSMQLHRDAALYDLAVYAHNYCFQIDEALQRTNCDELSKKFATVISYLQLYLIPSGTT
ncbi:plexin A3-like isoform X3 [Bolinopsis microptera]|uniref:plexin A3-like isoform X3 n=1 Tax=Bolinopsis microptera TaxID=2820187 RepID=UPI00307A4EFE